MHLLPASIHEMENAHVRAADWAAVEEAANNPVQAAEGAGTAGQVARRCSGTGLTLLRRNVSQVRQAFLPYAYAGSERLPYRLASGMILC